MKQIFIIIFILVQLGLCAQEESTTKLFINSFISFNKDVISMNELLVIKKNPMTIFEALTYVYNGDSTRLTCHGVYFDMENEKIKGHYSENAISYKLGKIEIGATSFVVYTTMECQDEESLWWTNIELAIYNNSVKKDSYTLYRENEYEAERKAILNNNKKIIFVMFPNNNKKVEYKLLQLSENKPYLIELKSSEQNIPTDNLLKIIDILGWKEDFGI